MYNSKWHVIPTSEISFFPSFLFLAPDRAEGPSTVYCELPPQDFFTFTIPFSMQGSTDVSIARWLRGFPVCSVVLEYHDPLQMIVTSNWFVFGIVRCLNIKGITLFVTLLGNCCKQLQFVFAWQWNITIDDFSIYSTANFVPLFHRSGTTHSTPKKVWKGVERKREVSIQYYLIRLTTLKFYFTFVLPAIEDLAIKQDLPILDSKITQFKSWQF